MKYLISLFLSSLLFSCSYENQNVILSPSNNMNNVNPDTHLKITFQSKPILGNSGMIRIFDAESNIQIDSLDLSISAGPTEPTKLPKAPYAATPYDYSRTTFATNANTHSGTPSGIAAPTSNDYQLTIIGGFSDGFHFYPVIINGNTATIYPHNNLLEYGKKYYVTVDKEVFSVQDSSFHGICKKDSWRFYTKKDKPTQKLHYIVDSNGNSDFSTVQGAMDFIPDFSKDTITIFIKNGNYEELIYFRNKSNIRLIGENRDSVYIHYANNEVFNPHPDDVSTNERPGTFPSRRAAFAADNCQNLYFENLTIATTCKGQAEGLLIMGEHNTLKNIHIIGDGDALQANGSLYMEDCTIDGGGDTMLGRGPAFLRRCTLSNNGGPFMWIRNTNENHGNVFIECTFKGNNSHLARAPRNHGSDYPYAEAVLINCTLEGIADEGWGSVGDDTRNLHYWEYNSKDSKGMLINTEKRHPASHRLTIPKDQQLIELYSSLNYVLGWR